jgi:hypothetical protein
VKILSVFSVILVLFTFTGCDKTNSPSDLKDKLDKYIDYWNTVNFNGIFEELNEDYELIESPKFEIRKELRHSNRACLLHIMLTMIFIW